MRKNITLFTAFTVILLSSYTAQARYREVDTIIFNPVTDGGKYLTVHESSTLPQWRFNFGVIGDYSREPLEIRDVNGRRPVVDDMLITNVSGAIGFTDWFQAGVNVPIIAWETWADPDTVVAVKEKEFGLGDIRLEAKFRLLDIERYHIGLAVVPFMTFPSISSGLLSTQDATLTTGWRNGKFASNETFTGGGKFVVEGEIKNRVWLAINAGYQVMKFRHYYTPNTDAWVDDTLLLGGAMHLRMHDAWRLIMEMYTETVAEPFSNMFQSQRQTPTEVVAAVRFQPQNPPEIRGLSFTVGGGRGLVSKGIGSPDLRVFAGIGFRKPKIVELPPPPPPAEVEAIVTEKIIITQKIHFEFNKSNIRPISFPILDDVVELLSKNPSIKKVEVGGHCDWIGGDAYNLRLSQKRAQSVVNYLTSKGIDSSRVSAKGFGESMPIADNNTTEGRAKNRRVEFTVLE
jgi:outer membrane protein OmpA-like peptidoglycan-associated protein